MVPFHHFHKLRNNRLPSGLVHDPYDSRRATLVHHADSPKRCSSGCTEETLNTEPPEMLKCTCGEIRLKHSNEVKIKVFSEQQGYDSSAVHGRLWDSSKLGAGKH